MLKTKKFLIRIEIVLVILTLFFSIVTILFHDILPSCGITVIYNINGTSMSPTIVEGAITFSKGVPYDELQVGDIIVFKERAEYKWGSSSTKTVLVKGDYTGIDDATLPAIAPESEDTETEGPGVDSTADPTAVKYTDETITHRIVSIEDTGIRTQGDNNNYNDPFPVTPDGYIAKVVWWNNHLGWPFKIMLEKHGFFWLIGVTVAVGGLIGVLAAKGSKDSNAEKDIPE